MTLTDDVETLTNLLIADTIFLAAGTMTQSNPIRGYWIGHLNGACEAICANVQTHRPASGWTSVSEGQVPIVVDDEYEVHNIISTDGDIPGMLSDEFEQRIENPSLVVTTDGELIMSTLDHTVSISWNSRNGV
jgi:hypothetical protein